MASTVSRADSSSPTRQAADVSPLLRPQKDDSEMEEPAVHASLRRTASQHNSSEGERIELLPPLASASRQPPNSSPFNIDHANWLPISLTRTYLFSLAILSLALGICCFILVAFSQKRNGLSMATDSAGSKFNQRYLPTFVAVLYTLLWRPVVVDIARTEPWALLSQPIAPRAVHALLTTDKMWWNQVADAIRNRRRPGGIRWALLVSIFAGLVASIVINPLSAGFLDTLNVLITKDQAFLGVVPSASDVSTLRIGDTTYLRAVTNMFFNVSTSAWNTDEYTVAPMWPSSFKEAPFGASLAHSSQLWMSNGEVLSAQVSCRPFTTGINETTPYGLNDTWTGLSSLQTDDGCAVQIPEAGQWCAGGKWSQISNVTSPTTLESCTAQGYREYFMFCSKNATSTALMRQGKDKSEKNYYAGQICSTSYFTAIVPLNVSTTPSGSIISFNEATFLKERRSMDHATINITEFENEFIRQTGSNHLQPTLGAGLDRNALTQNWKFEGPSLVLAASSNYSIDLLMQRDPNELAKEAAVIKQRFLGEVLLAGFKDLAAKKDTKFFRAEVVEQQYRLVVNLGLGIAIGAVFVLLAGAAATLAYLVQLSRRPLQLYRDPNMSSTAAAVLDDANSSACFKDLDRSLASEIDKALKDQLFTMKNGILIRVEDDSHIPASKPSIQSHVKPKRTMFGRRKRSAKKRKQEWRPFTLQRKSGSLLAVLLLSVTAALSAIYAVSRQRPLYQLAFVYQSDIKLGSLDVTTLAPYSILPTLVAVSVKLWWATIDSAYRRLTPFLAMASSPAPKASGGAALSFITTPICWITLLALRKGYWLLALVTFSTLGSEILQISMSALWARELGFLKMDTTLLGQFDIRSVAHVFDDSHPLYRTASNIAYPNIAQYLYGGEFYQTSWVYGSLAEMAFGASPPAWSKDGWSFPPVDISGVAKSLPKLPLADNSQTLQSGILSSLNVTFDNTGVKGRIDCTPIEDVSQWVLEVKNLANISHYNSSWTDTRPVLTSGFELSPRVRVVNFTNFDGTRPETVTIGQWLHSNYSSLADQGDPLYQPGNSPNFTVLWISATYPYLYESNVTGTARYVVKDLPPRLIFAKRPQVQALNCEPIFEMGTFNIVVNTEKSKIEEFTPLGSPSPVPGAWSDKFTAHYSNETAYYEVPPAGDTNALKSYNTTVSWGYLFQLALLQACNVQGFVSGTGDYLGAGIPGATPFSFIEPDLYSDPYSYASLALVGYDRTAMLNASVLSNVTQNVFSNFFQWFASSQSGYAGGYWAYQSLGAKLPTDLDFGALETWVTQTETFSRITTLCESVWHTYKTYYSDEGATKTFSAASCGKATLTSSSIWTSTQTSWTIIDTRTPPSSSPLHPATLTSSTVSRMTNIPVVTTHPQLHKRATPTDSRIIRATVSVRTETLVVSPLAVFLSVSIIVILLISTFVVYALNNNQLRLLPRDFDSLASVFATVYASEKLKTWAKRQHGKRSVASKHGQKRNTSEIDIDDDAVVKMGNFTGADGEEHWGVEIVEGQLSLLEKPYSQHDSVGRAEDSQSEAHRQSDGTSHGN